ncbi:oligoribonuclease [Bradymonadaceae bacterium TMQ3]|uniref:Oligoribonuclease n=1 Tax=Lujinxingia sediminis TaxID=2480984 RepID=A0ABY0CV28_9DELT|nr:oligoribonuclease [Lujinxingia sediminis]RDV36690.1 oligoribonuclease [Bradymonadaceae bacterium TMQ3]RVU46920.1 oligoribonuclease [Lujinxingia sediminis]TXC68531.1 oligoribonuclease [Bradymonadales bacterium TMQ1]
MASDRNLVWVDLEMTGLDPKTCTILEIATIVTDSQLQIVAEGPNLVIHHSDEVLDAMDAWNTEHHGKSGLTAAVKASKLTLAQAEAQTLAFVQEHCGPKSAPLCGNSIWQDRRFLAEYMPRLEDYLHYRIIDVSSVKEVVRRWYPAGVAMPPRKEQSHRALDDIKDSIEELKFYRSEVFVAPGGSATFATRR